MPKVKTNKVTRNRYKLTKNGKLTHRSQGKRHLRRKKSKSRQRRQDRSQTLTSKKHIRSIKRKIAKA